MTPTVIIFIIIIAILVIALIRKSTKFALFRSEFEFYEKYFNHHQTKDEEPEYSGIEPKRYYDVMRDFRNEQGINKTISASFKGALKRNDLLQKAHKQTIDTLNQEIRDQIETISNLSKENSELRQKINK